MDQDEMPTPVLWLLVSTVVGSLIVRLIDYWRLRIERDYNANRQEGDVLSYPWLAERPIWMGILLGAVVFAVGLYLINGYAKTAYLRPDPAAEATS